MGLIMSAKALICPAEQLQTISGISDIHRLDQELDHLHSLGLIQLGFVLSDVQAPPSADVAPTSLALNMYVRAHGSTKAAPDYFGVKNASPSPAETVRDSESSESVDLPAKE